LLNSFCRSVISFPPPSDSPSLRIVEAPLLPFSFSFSYLLDSLLVRLAFVSEPTPSPLLPQVGTVQDERSENPSLSPCLRRHFPFCFKNRFYGRKNCLFILDFQRYRSFPRMNSFFHPRATFPRKQVRASPSPIFFAVIPQNFLLLFRRLDETLISTTFPLILRSVPPFFRPSGLRARWLGYSAFFDRLTPLCCLAEHS